MFYKYVEQLVRKSDEIDRNRLEHNAENKQNFFQGLPSSYLDLEVHSGCGMGNWADIPWIGFTANGQRIQEGIYPVFLYYRKNGVLILAYGISATKPPTLDWGLDGAETIGKYFKKNNITKYNKKYNKSFIYKVYSPNSIGPSIDYDLNEIINYYKELIASKQGETSISANTMNKSNSSDRMINRIQDAIKQSGLLYSDVFISRFAVSLMTKPFVILSGLSGSGKTQLAIAFSKAMCADFEKQVRIVPVGADWTNREPLLGYPNALVEGQYVHPDSRVLQLLMDANRCPNLPFFLIMDEMNLSYVERYFADFLSALESKEEIPLWNHNGAKEIDVPKSIKLPKNLFIIGTINVDETTYVFSPKVLDRANVLEFKIDSDEMSSYLSASPDIDIEKIAGTLSDVAEDFVAHSNRSLVNSFSDSSKILMSFFDELKKVNAEFGYRSASEIGRFISLAKELGGLKGDDAIDAAIVQKLLPKLHGSRKKLDPVLKSIWALCETKTEIDDNPDPEKAKYKLTANKVLRMYKSAIENGFTSFAEA